METSLGKTGHMTELRDSKDSAEWNWAEIWLDYNYLAHFISGTTRLNTKRDTASFYIITCFILRLN